MFESDEKRISLFFFSIQTKLEKLNRLSSFLTYTFRVQGRPKGLHLNPKKIENESIANSRYKNQKNKS